MTSYHNSSFTIPIQRNPRLEEIIQKNSTEVKIKARSKFLEYGEILDGVYYIRSGRTKHYVYAEDGSEKIIYTLCAGWFYGETPLVLDEPTGLISEAMDDTVLWVIGYPVFQHLLDDSKLFRNSVFESMARKMLIMRHEIERLVFASCKERIFQLFCSTIENEEAGSEDWLDVPVKYTQYEISTLVGSARVTTSKLINELCNEGKIRFLNHRIQVSREAYENQAD
jgi:cAMP-binding proteins - catabolite gene activator and regulatory subunit of cAMP-dependent protein kinases